MATASTLIVRGLQMIGEKSIGGTLTADEQTAYLAVMNAMLDAWSLERLMCYQIVQESKALTTGTGTYTIGSGGAWNTTRPTQIVDPCFILDSANVRNEVEIINAQAYGRLSPELAGNSYPQYLFYDAAFVASLATIFLYPRPSASLTLYINSPRQITQFAAIGTTMVLPPGYEEAISSNFAIRAAAGYIPISQEVATIARESKAAIKRVNLPSGILRLDPGVIGRSGRSNILTGSA